jgi:hypothetical protein
MEKLSQKLLLAEDECFQYSNTSEHLSFLPKSKLLISNLIYHKASLNLNRVMLLLGFSSYCQTASKTAKILSFVGLNNNGNITSSFV